MAERVSATMMMAFMFRSFLKIFGLKILEKVGKRNDQRMQIGDEEWYRMYQEFRLSFGKRREMIIRSDDYIESLLTTFETKNIFPFSILNPISLFDLKITKYCK